jgi:uncharacterized protein (DUF433 family)
MKNNNLESRISINRNTCFGKPCIKNTRIPIYLILELLEAGYTTKQIIKDCYPQLKIKDIHAAIHYAAQIVKNEEILEVATV